MVQETVGRLEELARSDASAAPLARLQVEALRASTDPSWETRLPEFAAGHLKQGVPLLHGQSVRVEAARCLSLASRLASRAGGLEGGQLRLALESGVLDPVVLLESSVTWDMAGLKKLAAASGVDAGLLVTIGQLAAVPLLRACGRTAKPLLEGAYWMRGTCPVCGAWPTLAEDHSTERRMALWCGRCGVPWDYFYNTCAFCGNDDHETRGYLAPEGMQESRRASTCDRCHGYLKVVATNVPLKPAEVALRDLETLELDVAALERGYSRPERPDFPLCTHVVARD